jgi:hypothetical protein
MTGYDLRGRRPPGQGEKPAAAHRPAGTKKTRSGALGFRPDWRTQLPNDEPQGFGKHTHWEVQMFRLLVRFLGSGAGRGRPARANVRRFTPRLEALEQRANPSGGITSFGGEWLTPHAAVPDIGPAATVRVYGSKPGIGSGAGGHVTLFGGHGESGGATGPIGLSITRSSGEEIPQQYSITRSSGEEIPQHTTGPIGLSITRSSGEEIPQT